MAQSRSVSRVVRSVETHEGEGFLVHRPFPTQTLDHIDPFLLLDEMGPSELGPGEAKGAPDHPHRGFETVTYLLEGQMEHRDSAGNAGTLRPGDVQWMTAGSGVVHSEMPDPAFSSSGGRMHGFQLWVNLPRRDKMTAPRYQDVPSERIPVVRTPDGSITVKVIAGEVFGTRAVIDTRTPILYLHVTLAFDGRTSVPVPKDWNAFVYVFAGRVLVGRDRTPVDTGGMALLGSDGDEVALVSEEGPEAPPELLLIAGQPLREPVVRYGPFVMNTRDEIVQAFEDYRNGRLGRIA